MENKLSGEKKSFEHYLGRVGNERERERERESVYEKSVLEIL